jgi:hypothetical protein
VPSTHFCLLHCQEPIRITALLADVATTVLDVYQHAHSAAEFVENECLTIAKSCVSTIYVIMLWFTHDVYLQARGQLTRDQAARSSILRMRQQPSENAVESGEEHEKDDDRTTVLAGGVDASLAITAVIEIRKTLVQTLCQFIEFGETLTEDNLGASLSASVHDIHRVLQRDAFVLISDIRALFPTRESDHLVVAPLAFQPSAEVVNLLRKVFEHEGNRIKHAVALIEREAVNEDENAQCEQLNRLLVETLLAPLSSSMLFDIENLNRRQAASILHHLLEPSEIVQDIVRAVMQKLKDADLIKFLEVQMVCLKGMFLDKVVRRLNEARELEELMAAKKLEAKHDDRERRASKKRATLTHGAKEGQDSAEAEIRELEQRLEELETLITEGYESLELLAVKLSRSFGVAKFKGKHAEALHSFFNAFIDLAFQADSNLGALIMLDPYIRLLSPASVVQVLGSLELKIESDSQLTNILHSDVEFTRELQGVKLLRLKLGKPKSNKGRREVAAREEERDSSLDHDAATGRSSKASFGLLPDVTEEAASTSDDEVNMVVDIPNQPRQFKPSQSGSSQSQSTQSSKSAGKRNRSSAVAMGLELEDDEFAPSSEKLVKCHDAVAEACSLSPPQAFETKRRSRGTTSKGSRGEEDERGEEDLFANVRKSSRRKMYK